MPRNTVNKRSEYEGMSPKCLRNYFLMVHVKVNHQNDRANVVVTQEKGSYRRLRKLRAKTETEIHLLL